MKVCPFCREEIRDDAIKCRYCSSSLLPPQYTPESSSPTSAPGPNQVVYVLDQDLIRFAKFAGAVLALVVAVGVILYGIDLKQSVKDAEASAKEVQEVKNAVGKDRSETEKQLADANAALVSVQEKLRVIQTLAGKVEAATKSVSELQQKAEGLLREAEQDANLIARDALKAHSIVASLGPSQTPPSNDGAPTPNATSSARNQIFSVKELAKLYDFPTEFDGHGQAIGLIELGGGYADSDLESYFSKLNLSKPKITSVSVDGVGNAPGNNVNVDSEVTLEIEVVGALAPAAHIVVYFAPNTNQGFIDAVNTAVHDKANSLSVISISWGQPESNWTPNSLSLMNQEFAEAATLGLTVLTAAGDGGAADGVNDGQPHVDFPAASPWVLAVGGTQITVSGNTITSEVAWNDGIGGATGGGVSGIFPPPDWQTGVNVPGGKDGRKGRAIPDVAANASPTSGYAVYIDGKNTVVGGTAATAPFWAGLIAIINQGVNRNVGYINPLLYKKFGPAGTLRNIIQGTNSLGTVKGYAAGPGWNAVTGWGSPDGRKLLNAFQDELASQH